MQALPRRRTVGNAVTAVIASMSLSTHVALAQEIPEAIQLVVAYDEAGITPSKSYSIGYLTECVNNPYCQARLRGLEDAAEKYGFTFKIFDADFSPATQARVVEQAVTEGFDGYIFGPAAAESGCGLYNRLLIPTGVPVVLVDISMCGDPDYTEGLAASLTMQGQYHFDNYMEEAFSSCTEPCTVAAIGGYVGTDLYNYWIRAIEKAKENHPNVTVAVNEPADFDPRTALSKLQTALLANPDISVIVSSWDDMTRGAEQAVISQGLVPGVDVKIFSGGGTQVGIDKVKAGLWEWTMAFLPYEESYYGAVSLIMALEGQPLNAHIDEALLPQITETTGTVFFTKENADLYTPRY